MHFLSTYSKKNFLSFLQQKINLQNKYALVLLAVVAALVMLVVPVALVVIAVVAALVMLVVPVALVVIAVVGMLVVVDTVLFETELRPTINGVATAIPNKTTINNPLKNVNRERRALLDDCLLLFILLIMKITQYI